MQRQNQLFNESVQGVGGFIELYQAEYGFFVKDEVEVEKETVTLTDGYSTEIKIQNKLQNRENVIDKHCNYFDVTLQERTLDYHMNVKITVTSDDIEEIDCIINEWKMCVGME